MDDFHKTLIKVYNFHFQHRTYYNLNFTDVMVEIPSHKKSYNEELCIDISIPCSDFKSEFIKSVYGKFDKTDDEYVDLYVYATSPTGFQEDLKFKVDNDGFIIAEFA